MEEKYACLWSTKQQIESEYHDKEWGVPVSDDNLHFEMLTLEGAQSGLSWYTVLIKRENYKKAFCDFDPIKVSKFTQGKVETLLEDKGIIRHKLKILSTINNAKMIIKIQEEFGSFNKYIWSFVDFNPICNSWEKESDVPASTKLSDLIAKDLKKRGFKFLGTTTVYAYMQAIGIVNDHVTSCFCYEKISKLQKDFKESFKNK